MLGLPERTQIHKILFKKIIYSKFKNEMTSARRQSMDSDIARITLVNELSSTTINLPADTNETVNKPIFAVAVQLKQQDYNPDNIAMIAKLFSQRLIFILQYQDMIQLGIYQTKLITNDWRRQTEQQLTLNGLTLQQIWQNIVMQIGDIQIEDGNSLDEQIAKDNAKEKLLHKIAALENKALKEKQPRRKFALREQIKQLRESM